MNELSIIKINGGAYIDSREAAECIGKRHDHLLRDIGKYREIMAKIGLPKIGVSDFFVESSYVNAQNKVMPRYLITKMGAELIAHKLTGEKGVLFTLAYVKRFNELEAAERLELEKRSATPQLKAFNKAVKNVLTGYANNRATYEDVMDFLRAAYKPFGIEVAGCEGKYKWTATEIAAHLGIYSASGLPHGHAVAAIIEKLSLGLGHIAALPYGMVGVTIRYDDYVPDAVDKWLESQGFPRDISHLDFEYHIYFGRKLLNKYMAHIGCGVQPSFFFGDTETGCGEN
ncbi:MAG: Rha family transcriptional regulator [Clostridiales Family XIII bacterium]|jgi:Rha family phage regulatory protein|nr:Rha family transcriptional regulator [Clostridiales Family XIII bacterium]